MIVFKDGQVIEDRVVLDRMLAPGVVARREEGEMEQSGEGHSSAAG